VNLEGRQNAIVADGGEGMGEGSAEVCPAVGYYLYGVILM